MIQNKSIRAFTLLEVMVTLAITSVVFTISLSLLTSAASDQKTLQQEHRRTNKNIGLAALLEADIKCTRRFRTINNGYELNTLNHLEPITLSPRLLPTVVRYEIVKTDLGNWLIRSQLKKNNSWSRELIAGNCQSMSLSAQGKFTSDNTSLKIGDTVNILVEYDNSDDRFNSQITIE